MENNIETGNLDIVNANHPERRGWVLGNFVEESKLRNSDRCEVKWNRFPKGTKKSSIVDPNKKERTMTILISGKWHVKFKSGEEFTLSKSGDYIIYETMTHEAEALEASVMLTVRWKEI